MRFLDINKPLCCDDMIQCIFNLNNLDLKVYHIIKEKKEQKISNIAQILKKDRSTIQRSIKRLISCGLFKKKINKLSKGGYFYTYQLNEDKIIKQKIEKCIDKWYIKMKKLLKEY